ncbi:hypothetical protein OVY01_22935 [Robbsia sp. Bb-Pol-6]|uniref:HNH endonuclease n=1 Tax=Robbsia betulipollinis TaxID=2981849 RepID=A0ABT3ZTW6_9BURK|nr:hypothetical protein [Robbsia betulipollinis]MCY0389995.1 hypothetical protein [Robbsia betulipollinis]
MENIFHAKHVWPDIAHEWDGGDPYEADEPPPVTPIVIRALPEVFCDAVIADIGNVARSHTPGWLKKWVGIEQDLLCVYCGAALFIGKPIAGKRVANADALVPHALGGPLRAADNAVLCCASCKSEKGVSE